MNKKDRKAIQYFVKLILELHKCHTPEDIETVFAKKKLDTKGRILMLYTAIPRKFDPKKDMTLDIDAEYLLAVGAFLNADIDRRTAPVDFLTEYIVQDFQSQGIDRLSYFTKGTKNKENSE